MAQCLLCIFSHVAYLTPFASALRPGASRSPTTGLQPAPDPRSPHTQTLPTRTRPTGELAHAHAESGSPARRSKRNTCRSRRRHHHQPQVLCTGSVPVEEGGTGRSAMAIAERADSNEQGPTASPTKHTACRASRCRVLNADEEAEEKK